MGLLSIGEEPTKGTADVIEAHRLIAADQRIRFYGNVEGRDIMNRTVDVVVTDGFTGNVALKTIEGTAQGHPERAARHHRRLRRHQARRAAAARATCCRLRAALDPEEFGGALLVGMNAPVIIAHGNSRRQGHRQRRPARAGAAWSAICCPAIARELGGAAASCVDSLKPIRRFGRMTREEVFEHVKGILVETLSVDEDKVTMEARFQEDLETDSLDLVELVMTMEEKFGIKISDEEAAEIKTVGDAVDFVMTRVDA